MKKYLLTLLIMCVVIFVKAQTLSYNNNSQYNKIGQPGDFLVPELKITNTGASTVQVFVNRVQKNLPQNWLMCYCFLQCHPPSLDSLRFDMQAGETVTIGMGFTTDANAGGFGQVKITVEAVGTPQKDSLTFSATTLALGLTENGNSPTGKVFPCPVQNQLNYTGDLNYVSKLQLVNSEGRVLEETVPVNTRNSFQMDGYLPGSYYLRVYDLKGKAKDYKIIKN